MVTIIAQTVHITRKHRNIATLLLFPSIHCSVPWLRSRSAVHRNSLRAGAVLSFGGSSIGWRNTQKSNWWIVSCASLQRTSKKKIKNWQHTIYVMLIHWLNIRICVSQSTEVKYIATVYAHNQCFHLFIRQIDGKYAIGQPKSNEMQFEKPADIINYFRLNQLLCTNQQTCVKVFLVPIAWLAGQMPIELRCHHTSNSQLRTKSISFVMRNNNSNNNNNNL